MSELINTIEPCACGCSALSLSQTRTSEIRIEGLDCADCAASLEKKLVRSPGIIKASVNFMTGTVRVEHSCSPEDIIGSIEQSGYRVYIDQKSARDTFEVSGLDCADCAAKLERYIAGMPGVLRVSLNFNTAILTVEHTGNREDILKAISGMGYGYRQAGAARKKISEPFISRNKKVLLTSFSGVTLLAGIVASYTGMPEHIVIPIFLLTMLSGGYYVARSAAYSIKALVPDMNLLMTIAVLGAILIGEWEEAATVVFLFSLGNALQSYTMSRTRNSIKSLMSLAPEEACITRGGRESRVNVSSVNVGDIMIIRPGERIAMDGRVIKGVSSVNESSITGESIPVEKTAGSNVFAGTINDRGSLEVKVTKRAGDSTLSRIMRLVERAQASKAHSQVFIDRFARYYTPAVITGAIGLAVVPTLFGQPFEVWFYRALVLLVISCPCALVISTPVSIVAAIGNASRNGVLVKGGSFLEELSRIKAMAFDKTGTLTHGKPEVTDIVTYGVSEDEAITLAASIESRSEHPLASAIMKMNGNRSLSQVDSFESITGAGVKATIRGQTYCIGSQRMFDAIPSEVRNTIESFQSDGKIPVILGSRDRVLAVFAIIDEVRSDSADAIKSLHDAGINETVMLTGDSEGTARAISKKTGVDGYYAGLLPEDKVTAINSMKEKHGHVAMVGDGVNDAPALAASNVGFAMGATGSDTAIETADIALMSNDLSKLSFTVNLSRRTMKIIKQNVLLSVGIKAMFIVLAIMGMANLWMALFADTGTAILVILNGMRLLR